MQKTNIILNIIIKLFTIFLAITYGFGILYVYGGNGINLLFLILGIILCIFIFMTSIIDMIKIKEFDVKTNVFNLILVLLILLNIYRPFLDSLLLSNLVNNFSINANNSLILFEQNFYLITIFMVTLFLINFKLDKK